jgi:hypothetical protein
MYLLLPGLGLMLMVFALVDIIRADRWTVRHLDKSMWIIIVILLPLIGSVLWFAIGGDYGRAVDLGSFGDPRRREALPLVESTTERELAALNREIERHEQDRRLEAKLRAHRGKTTSDNS